MHRKASAGTQDLRKVCSTLACKCNSRDLVHYLRISALQWRLWAATPPKGIQPCQAESRLVLPKLQGKMCELWQPLAEERRGRHMVCHMCISTMQWRLRRATPRKTSQPCKTPAEMVLSTLQCSETMCQLCRPFAEQCRGRHMVCHMCISTLQWRLRRAPPT